jgi:DNA-dependent RNA polymerase auxiliary subunit epsilon
MSREYGLRKTENYYIRANSEEEAREKLNQMDNSYAWTVEVDVCYVSGELQEWEKEGADA